MKNYNYKKIMLWVAGFFVVAKFFLPSLLKPFTDLFSAIGSRLTGDKINEVLNSDNSVDSGGNINVENREQVCTDVANKCQVAIWNFYKGFVFWMHRWDEDESEVIKQLNRLQNASEARLASQRYAALTDSFGGNKKSLKEDVLSKLETSDRNKIKSVVLNNLL